MAWSHVVLLCMALFGKFKARFILYSWSGLFVVGSGILALGGVMQGTVWQGFHNHFLRRGSAMLGDVR